MIRAEKQWLQTGFPLEPHKKTAASVQFMFESRHLFIITICNSNSNNSNVQGSVYFSPCASLLTLLGPYVIIPLNWILAGYKLD